MKLKDLNILQSQHQKQREVLAHYLTLAQLNTPLYHISPSEKDAGKNLSSYTNVRVKSNQNDIHCVSICRIRCNADGWRYHVYSQIRSEILELEKLHVQSWSWRTAMEWQNLLATRQQCIVCFKIYKGFFTSRQCYILLLKNDIRISFISIKSQNWIINFSA